MNIKRTIAAILAFLAFHFFCGMQGRRKTIDFNSVQRCRCSSI